MIQSKNRKDMVFVFLPSSNFSEAQFTSSLTNALGPAYVIAYLKHHGFDVEQVVSSKALNVSECARFIRGKKPRIVGFTVYFNNYNSSVLLAKALKELDPNLIIVFGGPTATVQSQVVLEQTGCVDICVRNEGEETALELLTSLRGTNYTPEPAVLSQIEGLSYKVENRVFTNNDRNILLENRGRRDFLDKYPSPYLTGVLDDFKTGVLTARGCNQNCTYCNCAVLSKRAIVTHSIDRVVEELGCISRMSIPSGEAVIIFDDAFTLIPKRATRICQRIIESKIRLPLSCITRCDKIDKNLLDLMKEAGFITVGFSLESATPHVLRNIGKLQPPDATRDPGFKKEKFFIEQFQENVKYAKKIGLFTEEYCSFRQTPGVEQTAYKIRSLQVLGEFIT